jgi:N-acetylglucosamine kinase-like BadF-type ATPase
VLAIDGGNSKTDLALIAADGTLLASVRGPGASQEHHGIDGAMQRLGKMVGELAAAAGVASEGLVARHISSCLAGADLPEEEEQLAEALRRQGWSLTSAVANDTFAVLRAGLTPPPGQPAWGVAVTCGAGINCAGMAPDGQTTRFLALGRLTGDWGGGWYLGQEVMWWAMRAEDGRGPDTALRPATAAYFGLPTVRDVALAVHLGRIDRAEMLGLTTVLFETASAGDAVARDLLERLAEEVTAMAVTVMRRLGLTGPGALGTPVVLGGGLLAARHPLLTAAIERRLAAAAPGAVPHVTDTLPVTGAALLGLDYLGAGPDAERRLRAATVTPLPGEAAGQVIVHQAAGLHRGVGGDRPGEDEAVLAQLGGQRLRGGGLRRDVGKRARRRARRVRVGETPDQVAEPGPQLECGPGVRDHGADLRPVPHDARVGQQSLLVGRAERGDRRDVEASEGRAEVFPLPQDRQPGQPRLEGLEAQPFEDHRVIADRAAPFGVVVGEVLRGAESPGAAQPAVGAWHRLAGLELSHGTVRAARPDHCPRRAAAALRPPSRPRAWRSPR